MIVSGRRSCKEYKKGLKTILDKGKMEIEEINDKKAKEIVQKMCDEIKNLEEGYPFVYERDIYAKQDVMELDLDAGDVCTVQAFNQAQEDLLVRLIREDKIGFLKD